MTTIDIILDALISSTIGDPVLVAKSKIRNQWIGKWPTSNEELSKIFIPNQNATLLPPIAGSHITPSEFRSNYIKQSIPVLFNDLMNDWSITQNTKSFLDANLQNNVQIAGTDVDGHTVSILLSDFLQYMNGNKETEVEVQHDRNPMYIFDSLLLNTNDNISQNWYNVPSLFSDDDLLQYITPIDRPKYKWLLIGPQRSGSSMHQDLINGMETNAWNALISGAKHWILFHPDTPKEIIFNKNGDSGGGKSNLNGTHWNDLFGWYQNDLDIIKQHVHEYFKKKDKDTNVVRCYEFIQQPGEIIFVPSNWYHAVFNVQDSIAITQNFIDRRNLNQCFQSMMKKDHKNGSCTKNEFEMTLKEMKPELFL